MVRLLALLVWLGPAVVGCAEGDADSAGQGSLIALEITDKNELIGGPTAVGKIGDFLLANDKVRFIIAGKGQTWMGGVFGGSLVDADLQRWRADLRHAKGWDSFAETFPLVNLVVANPALPGRELSLEEKQVKLVAIPSGIEVVSDGRDGEARVRVTGRVGYMFETFKFLNKDFLASFLNTEVFMGKTAAELLDWALQVNVYALINRLQLDFHFRNDYILRAGQTYLTLETTITTAPPSETSMDRCPSTSGCGKGCDYGFSLEEIEVDVEGAKVPVRVLCPSCECANETQEMMTLNESEDIFQVMLGDLEPWRDQTWKGGILGGDFLFFGSQANIFSPGLGFDENRKIFENLWQGVPTLANPITFDWVAAVADNVSYGWVTQNPEMRRGLECPTYRLALTRLDYETETQVVGVLVKKLGFAEDFAQSRARHVIVDRRPLPLAEFPVDAKAKDFEAWRTDLLESAILALVADPADPDAPTEALAAELFPESVRLELIPALECLPSKVLIPIFTTSATAVMTHKSPSSLDVEDGVAVDRNRRYKFTRYLVVGEGDVGSVLETVLELKGLSSGRVAGAVMDEKTLVPVQHASVFAIKDPRLPADDETRFETYADLVAACLAEFGNEGIVSQMQTDRGLDPMVDGDYSGPLEPGRYFLVAFAKGRGVSAPVAVTVEEGETATAHLVIPSYGEVQFMVRDQGGQLLPSRLSFIPLEDDGKPARWDERNLVELGGSRYDQGVYLSEHSARGQGTVELPAGRYEVYVSRGFEYSLEHWESFEVLAGQKVPLEAVLVREVDTSGYISGDFHVHAQRSIDSSLPFKLRVTANAAEGVEFITSTDHDVLVDYDPYINELELHPFIKSAVGVETTTFEFGHFNGFPMEYDDTDIPVHNPAPWFGLSIADVWSEMRARRQKGVPEDAFIIQVNHPRDGFSGYLSQLGLKGYNLERSTPGMEMCNPQTEEIPCNFDTIELMNEKRFELLFTPTVAEKHLHNVCFEQIMLATRKKLFTNMAPDKKVADDLLVCPQAKEPPHQGCDKAEAKVASAAVEGLELARVFAVRDHCRWHEEFLDDISKCTNEMSLVKCKKQALDALKLYTVRYMMERTPEEQAAYFATTSDTGCDYDDALKGTAAITEENGDYVPGCDGCSCEACVCDLHPECCPEPEEGEPEVELSGWTEACAAACVDECHGGAIRPCTSKQEIFDDWFTFLNYGFNVTAVGNSDSHDTKKEVGFPRNYIVSSTDDPSAIDPIEIFRNIKQRRTFISSGPFVNFTINGANLGDTLDSPGGDKLEARLKIQTASWFGIDRILIYRNARLEHVIPVESDKTQIVDFDETLELDMPGEDSWYVIIAYGLDTEHLMSPVYKRVPLGKMLIPTIISLGAQSILISFRSVIDEIETNFGDLLKLGGIDSITDLLGDFMGIEELPDSFPMFPLALTNPIWVDVDGGGFKPPAYAEEDRKKDGSWPLPPFCSQACDVVIAVDEDGVALVDAQGDPEYVRSTCGENQKCIPAAAGDKTGICKIPIDANCVGSQVEAP